MSKSKLNEPAERPFWTDILFAIRYYAGGRRGLLAIAAIALAVGLTTNWSWLVAAGFAPLILGLLPCAAMCALGMCMNHKGGDNAADDGSCCSKPPANDRDEIGPPDA